MKDSKAKAIIFGLALTLLSLLLITTPAKSCGNPIPLGTCLTAAPAMRGWPLAVSEPDLIVVTVPVAFSLVADFIFWTLLSFLVLNGLQKSRRRAA